jgi:tRNA dimethylallyltransferase
VERLIVVVGPTAVGKSQLAIELALRFGGEIVNGDSRQVYRYMDVGTAKPSPEQRRQVPHHLIDIVDPDESFSLAVYQAKALQAIRDIQARGKLPLLVGGSGLYVWAVVENWQVPRVQPNPALRKMLEEEATRKGHAVLFQKLVEVDPRAAEKIDPRNVRRVIRALEVSGDAGMPFSELQKKGKPLFQSLIIGLTMSRQELFRRIDERVTRMMERGLVDEVRELRNKGYSFDLAPMSGIGYSEVGAYLRGLMDIETAMSRMRYRTHQLVRRQYNWFSLEDGRIRWLDANGSSGDRAAMLVEEFTQV